MKKISLVIAALALSLSAVAVPAKRVWRTVVQSDGTTLEVCLTGDERLHYLITRDGVPVVQTADGSYCYARVSGSTVSASTLLAHEAALRTDRETRYLTTEQPALRMAGMRRVAAKSQPSRKLKVPTSSFRGEKKAPVILACFSDKSFAAGETATTEFYNRMLNEQGFSDHGAAGSVRDYFGDMSRGLFDLTFDLIGPVRVSKSATYYGGPSLYMGGTDHVGEFITEVVTKADSLYNIDWTKYDWDGDGEVDQVYLIYAGYNEAEAYYTHPDAVWAHEWAMSAAGYNLTLDGVKVDTYGCSSELKGSSGTNICGIGTPCHEFSHCMGLPDLYDTTSSGAYGMDAWSIMDYGCYNGDQNVPAGYTSFERWVSGWLEPTELKEGQQVSGMQPLAEKAEAYVIYNEANQDEFYLLENRQLVSDDASLQGHGMLVLHVDYDETAWAENTMNDVKSHQRCTVIAADNSYENGVGSYEYDADGDPYPGTSGNTELTNTSTPKASLYNANTDGKKLMNKPITKIAETADGTISFTFRGGRQVFGPTEPTTTDVTSTSFTANWKAAGGAMRYELELKEKTAAATPDECLVLSEDLTLLGADRSDDSNADISSYLDQYLTTTGWTGEKLYEGAGTLKIGSSKKAGTLTSPLLSAPESGSVTVVLTAHPYKNDKPALTLSLLNESGKQKKSATLTADATAQYATFTDVTADYSVSLATTKRAYLDHIAVYDGAFSADDFAAESPRLSAATLLSAATTVTLLSDKTAYTFTGLKPGTAYRWRVRSGNGTALSEWTDWQDVSTLTAEGIGRVISAAALSADTPVTVIAPDGRTLKHTTYGAFKAAPAHHGTYLLRTPLGTVKAVR